jgi:hypothetical protein
MNVEQGSEVVDRNGEVIGVVSGCLPSIEPDGMTHVLVADEQRPGMRVAVALRDVAESKDGTTRITLTRADIDRLEASRGAPATGESGLVAEDPSDVGLSHVEVTITDVEPMHELANDARDELHRRGFTDDEIDDWARQFVARHGKGDEQEFIAWIAEQEHPQARRP